MHIHTQTTTGAHHTRIFAGEEWKRENALGVESWLKEEERVKYVHKMLIQLDLADKYLQMLEREDIDVRTLLETLQVGGRLALLQLLEDAGVDKAGARARIANYVQQSVDKNSEFIQQSSGP